jgi:hypothetical protein
MRKAILAVAALGVLLAVVPAAVAQCVTGVNGQAGDTCTTLYAGQTIDAGTVCSSVNGDNLDVTFTTTGGWELEEAHLWVGTKLSDMPQTKKGNPKIGNFPYNSGDISGSTEGQRRRYLPDRDRLGRRPEHRGQGQLGHVHRGHAELRL